MTDQEVIVYQELHNQNNILFSYEHLQYIFEKSKIIELLKDKNIEISSFDIKKFQKAFTHISYSEQRNKRFNKNTVETESPDVDIEKCVQIQKDSLEKLEWLGDSILQSVVATYLWKRFPRKDEGFLTKTRSKLVRTESFAKFGEFLNFGKYLLISKYVEEYNNGRENPNNLEDSFEAFTGVLWLETNKEHGYDIVSKFVYNILEVVIDLPMLILADTNYRDQLMHIFHKKYNGKLPEYKEISSTEAYEEKDGKMIKKRTFTYSVCDIDGKEIALGISSKSKKDAMQKAAKEACRYYGEKVYDKINPYTI